MSTDKGNNPQQPSADLQELVRRAQSGAPAPEKMEKFVRGEITLRELNGVSGPEMLEMAVIGFQMYEQGKYEEAKVVFTGLAALDPFEAYFATALGAVHLAQESLDEAEKCFDRAIELNPKEISPYVNRGEVYLRKGKVLEAAEDFKKVLELDPEGKDPLTARARVLALAAYETMKIAQEELDKHGEINMESFQQPAATEKKATGKAAKPSGKGDKGSSKAGAGKKK